MPPHIPKTPCSLFVLLAQQNLVHVCSTTQSTFSHSSVQSAAHPLTTPVPVSHALMSTGKCAAGTCQAVRVCGTAEATRIATHEEPSGLCLLTP